MIGGEGEGKGQGRGHWRGQGRGQGRGRPDGGRGHRGRPYLSNEIHANLGELLIVIHGLTGGWTADIQYSGISNLDFSSTA